MTKKHCDICDGVLELSDRVELTIVPHKTSLQPAIRKTIRIRLIPMVISPSLHDDDAGVTCDLCEDCLVTAVASRLNSCEPRKAATNA